MRKLRQVSRRSRVWLLIIAAGTLLSIASGHANRIAGTSMREPASLIVLGTGLIGLARAQRSDADDRADVSTP